MDGYNTYEGVCVLNVFSRMKESIVFVGVVLVPGTGWGAL